MEGTNFQDNIASIHHVSVPWRPSDIMQRNGRGIRQGNKNAEVEEFRYVVKKSFDAYSWQIIEYKATDIEKVLNADKTIRSLEDVEDHVFSYAETKACACGDTRILEVNKIEQEVKRLTFLAKSHNESKLSIHRRIKENEKLINSLKDNIPLLQEDIKRMAKAMKSNNLIKLNEFDFNNDMDKLKECFKEIIIRDYPGMLGTLYGLDMYYDKFDKKIYIGESDLLYVKFYKMPGKMLKDLFNIKNLLKDIYAKSVEKYKYALSENEQLKVKVNKPFEFTQKLNELKLEKKSLEDSLLLDSDLNENVS